jgi:hypothetical protein
VGNQRPLADSQSPETKEPEVSEVKEPVASAQPNKLQRKRKRSMNTATSKKTTPSKAQQCPTVVGQHNFRLDNWKNGRPWLRYEIGLGMWCDICNRHKTNRIVISIGSAVNPLRVPTQAYRFYRVNGHENKRFHLHAVMLDSQASAHSVVDLTWTSPSTALKCKPT